MDLVLNRPILGKSHIKILHNLMNADARNNRKFIINIKGYPGFVSMTAWCLLATFDYDRN